MRTALFICLRILTINKADPKRGSNSSTKGSANIKIVQVTAVPQFPTNAQLLTAGDGSAITY